MLKTNPIRRRFRGVYSVIVSTGRSNAHKEWFAICPQCSVEITPHTGWPHYNHGTRKSTKDALYRHVQEEHKPGSVGRPTA
jgi:hypothetical protein